MILLLIVLQIFEIQACNSIVQERSVYPTDGEYYKLDMNQIFIDCQIFHCRNCNDEIQIFNASKLLTRQEINYTFFSVVSNETHLIGLTSQQLFIYIKQVDNQIQLEQAYDLPLQVICNNSIVMNLTQIIIDCYNNDSLIIYQLQDGQFQNYYNSSSTMPINSKLSIYQGQYLLYAQYFEQYQILTSFIFNNTIQEYLNMSSLQTFSDFIVSYDFIYISNLSTISQYKLNESGFIHVKQQVLNSEIQQISVYNSLRSQSECDQLIILLQEQPYLQKIFGCNNSFYFMNTNNLYYEPLNLITQILSNDDFIILKNNSQIMQLKNDQTFELLYEHYYKQSFQLTLSDDGNILYYFGNLEYSAFSLQYPSLIINAANQLNLSNYPIKIQGSKLNFNHNTNDLSQSKIYITTLSENDSQIYVQFQPKNSHFFEDNNYVEDIIQYSGQLLNVTDNKYFLNANFGNFLDTTIKNTDIDINQYQFLQILYTPYFQNNNTSLFQVYYNQNQLFFFDCPQQYVICSQLNHDQSLNYMYQVIAGAQIDDKMIQCVFLDNTNKTQNSSITAQQSIIQYLISYNSIIILQNNSIIIYFDCQQKLSKLLDQDQINKLFNNSNYPFNPINITMNIQYLSSVLYINNKSNILAVSILNSQQIIPISRINQQINSNIYGIYLVNNRLILSFFDNFTLNFQVWNVENIFKPYFEKNLKSIITQNLISIQNDNQFLYVIFNSSNIYIYNPELSQHMALYQNLSFQNAIYGKICSTQLQTKNALLILNQTSYFIQISNQMTFTITPNFINTIYYPQLLYNFTLQSQIYPYNKLTTLSQLLIYLYNFTIINYRNDTKNLTSFEVLHNNFNYTIPKGKNKNILDDLAQIANCSQLQSKQISCNSVNFYNYYETNLQSKTKYLYAYLNNYLVIQDNQDLYILYPQKSSAINHNIQSLINQKYLHPYKTTYSFSTSFEKCVISTSQKSYLYSICESKNNQYYWLQFEIIKNDQVNQANIFPLNYNFSTIQKINSQQFILNNFSLYYYNSTSKNCSLIVNNCSDFFSTSIHFLNQELIALLFIDQNYNQIFYIFLNNNYQIITKQTQIKLELLSYQKIYFFEILLIQQKENSFMILLKTNCSLNYILELKLVFTQNQFNIIFSQILRLIPQIPQFFQKNITIINNVGSYINQNFLWMSQSYQNNSQYYLQFSLYNLSDISIPTLLMKPILMIQQFEQSSRLPYKIYQQQQYSVDSNQQYMMNYSNLILYIFGIKTNGTALILSPILEEFNCQVPQDTIITDFLLSCQNSLSYQNLTINLQFKKPPIVYNFIIVTLVTFGLLTFLIMYMLHQKVDIKLELV